MLRPNSRSCRTASIRSGRAGGLAGELSQRGGAMNTFLLLVVALAVIGTLGIFLGEIFVLMIAVALAMFYAALFLFAPTTIDAIPDATKNVLIIAMMVGAVLSLILGRRRKI